MLIDEKSNKIVMMLPITQVMSRPIISFVQLCRIGFFKAVNRTKNENTIKKIPTPRKGFLLLTLNRFPKKVGINANNHPVIPELIPLVSKTFFSVIVYVFCFPKDILRRGLKYYHFPPINLLFTPIHY